MTEQGAEAVLEHHDGRLTKQRIPKGYRHPKIDEEIRRERTEQEARLLEKARQAGVITPSVEKKDEFTLSMDFIDGDKLRDVFEERNDLWPRIGKNIARLHTRDIIHGDLTTSNMILTDGEVCFIDFGLGFFSQRVEDRATDLRLLRQVLEATHHTVWERAWEAILDGYRDTSDQAEDVMERLEEAESRGRYK